MHLDRVFEEVGGYNEIVLLKDIPFQSHCEHHMAPIIGKAAIAYLPNDRVVGISKLARVLHGFARRLQVQERLTAEVADCIWENLQPQGVAVVIEASHSCMTARGVRTPGVGMITSRMMGTFLDDQRSRKEVLSLMGYGYRPGARPRRQTLSGRNAPLGAVPGGAFACYRQADGPVLHLAEHVFRAGNREIARRFDIELRHDTVFHHHRIALAALAETEARTIHRQPHGFGEIAIAVREHGDVVRSGGTLPRAHDECVIHCGRHDLVDTLGLEIFRLLDVAGQVTRRTGRRECARGPKTGRPSCP